MNFFAQAPLDRLVHQAWTVSLVGTVHLAHLVAQGPAVNRVMTVSPARTDYLAGTVRMGTRVLRVQRDRPERMVPTGRREPKVCLVRRDRPAPLVPAAGSATRARPAHQDQTVRPGRRERMAGTDPPARPDHPDSTGHREPRVPWDQMDRPDSRGKQGPQVQGDYLDLKVTLRRSNRHSKLNPPIVHLNLATEHRYNPFCSSRTSTPPTTPTRPTSSVPPTPRPSLWACLPPVQTPSACSTPSVSVSGMCR